MHEHLAEKHPAKKMQSMKARMHESKGMEHEMHHDAAHALESHAHHKKMHAHHLKEAKKCMDSMCKMSAKRKAK